jgi:DNA repair exonuclease SbcCD ATPase subunit
MGDQEEAAYSACKKAYEDALKEQGRCGQEISQLQEQVKRAGELTVELNSNRVSRDMYLQLEKDLGSERFQAFLFDEVFNELVRGASERLWNLTDVYRLEWDKNAFTLSTTTMVTSGAADTLNGGETFWPHSR